jgi:hypothetical protein
MHLLEAFTTLRTFLQQYERKNGDILNFEK